MKKSSREFRFRRLLAIIFIFACLSLPVAALAQKAVPRKQGESWRKQPPRSGPARPFKLPSAREIKLQTGLTLVMIEDHRSPMVTINLGIPVGSALDPAESLGLAEAVASLLTEGAGTRTSEQLAREVETLGGRISSFATEDYSRIVVSVVSENAERMMDMIGDVALRPAFPEEEVSLYKENRIQSLTVQRQDPAFLVSEHFNRIIYGPHPYAISAPTPESIAAMDRKKIESFYKASYTPSSAVLVIAGDFDSKKMEAKVRAVFGGWKAPPAGEKKFPAMPERKARHIYLIDRPGSEQADFRIGNLALTRQDADYFPLLVANTILGGGTSSRL
ncbi:MAG: insulinase family protein, partial [Blastocatellia bacterium]|nr:insulinase family protein [Blastocatellia bacterium]